MQKFNPYDRFYETKMRHLQVIYLALVCDMPYGKIAEITDYAVSTITTYIRKYAESLEEAKQTFSIEPVQVLFRKFKDGRSVAMEFMPGFGEILTNQQIVYFFKFYGTDGLLFDKIGTTTKDPVKRLRDEIGGYSKKFPIDRVEIHRIRSCGNIPAEGYESELRSKLIFDHPTAFRKNDRFFGADIPAWKFDQICDQYAQ